MKHMHACPGSALQDLRNKKAKKENISVKQESELNQWPVQLTLLPPTAPFFNNSDLLIAADCVPFAYANFHSDFLKNKALLIGCPKLDDVEPYIKKLIELFKHNKVNSITIAHMEVPCCYGLNSMVEEALEKANKKIPVKQQVISVNGEIIQ